MKRGSDWRSRLRKTVSPYCFTNRSVRGSAFNFTTLTWANRKCAKRPMSTRSRARSVYCSAITSRAIASGTGCARWIIGLTPRGRLVAHRLHGEFGPQHAEQNLPPFLADGLDQADFVIAFAPKPYLILSAMRDFFPIAGTRQTFREAKRLYGLMGAEEKLNMVEADDEHGYTRPRRLAAYRWMNRWLKGADEPIDEPEIEIESEEDLRCTAKGQISLSLGGETIF